MKITVEFTEQLFKKEYVPVFLKYFNREINAREACQTLKWTKTVWDAHLAAIFTKGNSKIKIEK